MISLADAQTRLADLVDAVKEGPVLLLREGRPCAALVGLGERFDPEAFSLGRNKRLRQRIDEACRRTRETGGIMFSEILAEVDRQEAGRKTRPPRRRGQNS
jgi:prevent-host-death family protein